MPPARLGRRPPDAAARRIAHVRSDVAGIEILDVDIFDKADNRRQVAIEDLCLQQALGIRAVNRGHPATKLGAVRKLSVGRGETEPVTMQVLAQRHLAHSTTQLFDVGCAGASRLAFPCGRRRGASAASGAREFTARRTTAYGDLICSPTPSLP